MEGLVFDDLCRIVVLLFSVICSVFCGILMMGVVLFGNYFDLFWGMVLNIIMIVTVFYFVFTVLNSLLDIIN